VEIDSTSLFRTTEEFYVRQDEFRRYIADEVNPARAKHGLSEIRDDEARECFRIMDKFFAEWRKPFPAAHTSKDVSGA
jgi:hypothetical protein